MQGKRVMITRLAYGGSGVGRIDGKVVFVPFTAPGDEVLIEITSEKKSFSEGVLLEILTPSPERVDSPCPVFGVCGGCSYQHIAYEAEVRWKEEIFLETLKRIGKAVPKEVDPPLPSPTPYGYRLRARFHVKDGRFGFFKSATNDVVDIDSCPILAPEVNGAFGRLKGFFRGSGALPVLTSFEVGLSRKDNKTVAALYVEKGSGFPWGDLLSEVPGLKGIEVIRAAGAGGAGGAGREKVGRGGRGREGGEENPKERRIAAEGDIRLDYKACGLEFSVPLRVFSQANSFQVEPLIEKVLEYAAPGGEAKRLRLVLDLFSGAGNLTLPLSRVAERAIGVESDREAAAAAVWNARLNRIENLSFTRMDASSWIAAEFKGLEKEGVDVVVLDPPRGGDKFVAGALSGLNPRKVVYVSCSPPTLARDLGLLAAGGYMPAKACHIDMFPQTSHIEGIVVLER